MVRLLASSGMIITEGRSLVLRWLYGTCPPLSPISIATITMISGDGIWAGGCEGYSEVSLWS